MGLITTHIIVFMYKFTSNIVNGDDGKAKIFSNLSEISTLGEKWEQKVNNIMNDFHFENGSEWIVKGFVLREGTFTNDNGTQKDFAYIAVYLQDANDPTHFEDFSVRALESKKRDWSQTPSKLVERPENSLLRSEVEKCIGKKVKCVRTPYCDRFPNGRLNEDAVMVSFVKE